MEGWISEKYKQSIKPELLETGANWKTAFNVKRRPVGPAKDFLPQQDA